MCVLSCYGRDKVSQGQSPEFFSLLQYQHLYMLFHVPFQTFLWNKIDTQTISTFYSKIECVRKFFQGHLGANFRFWGGVTPWPPPGFVAFEKVLAGRFSLEVFSLCRKFIFIVLFQERCWGGGEAEQSSRTTPPPLDSLSLASSFFTFHVFFLPDSKSGIRSRPKVT